MVQGNSSVGLLSDMIETASGDPMVAAALLVNFLVGLGLGYLTVKIAKYIAAAVGLIAALVAFNVWVYGNSMDNIAPLKRIAEEMSGEVKQALIETAKLLGLMTLSPLTIGFIVGAVIGATR
ncbi:MAG: hypothetical protein GSR86_04280 [Desulfurococcales archaeon]|nr:hypothetical protein [Desulfurococcales archaeon]